MIEIWKMKNSNQNSLSIMLLNSDVESYSYNIGPEAFV